MKSILMPLLLSMSFLKTNSQEIVKIPTSGTPEDVIWENEERQFYNTIWETETVGNVTEPTMEVFQPEAGKANGTSVVICPGGGMYLLSIYSEGNEVAKWLAKEGVTGFVFLLINGLSDLGSGCMSWVLWNRLMGLTIRLF